MLNTTIKSSIKHLDAITLCGLATDITNSPTKNSTLCASFWKVFNQALAANKLQQRANWTKYAITYNDNAQYKYLCAIPASQNIPPEFQIITLPESHYVVFEHRGHTSGLVQTLEYIYQKVLPDSTLKHDTSKFLHFEKYDHRFNWNNANSLIEIWVPIIHNDLK